MNVNLNIDNMDKTENAARQILAHIEAIKQIQKESQWNAITISMVIQNKEAASGH